MCVLKTEPVILVFDFLFTPALHHGIDVHLFPHCFLQTFLFPSTSHWPSLLKLTMSDCCPHHYPLMLLDVSIPVLMLVTSVSTSMDDCSSSQPPRGPNLSLPSVCAQLLGHIWLFVAPWSVSHQAPLSMGFSRQEYWSGLPFPSPGDLPHSGIEPGSLAMQPASLPTELPGKVQRKLGCGGLVANIC